MDLNANYQQLRLERAKKLAVQWLNQIEDKLKDMHYRQSRQNFRDWVAQGNRLTFDELRNLKDENLKVDYVHQQLMEDFMVRKLII